jgi:hypothetical protein
VGHSQQAVLRQGWATSLRSAHDECVYEARKLFQWNGFSLPMAGSAFAYESGEGTSGVSSNKRDLIVRAPWGLSLVRTNSWKRKEQVAGFLLSKQHLLPRNGGLQRTTTPPAFPESGLHLESAS